jgi:thioredoxin 1
MIADNEIDNFIKNTDVALLKFHADWCNSCKKYDYYLNELSIKVLSIDIDLNEDIKEEFEIAILPTILIYKNSNLVDKIEGFVNKTDFIKKLNILNN